jgi:predicted MPP superfamily phosphohydrolase
VPLPNVSRTLSRTIHEPDWRKQMGLRRRVWRGLGRLGLTGLHAGPIHRSWLDVRRLTMDLPGLPDAWVGRRIVQLSDLHASPVVWRGFLREQLRHAAKLNPDLVVVTGDLVTGGYRYARLAARLLQELTPPLGVIATLGNHDYGLPAKRSRREGDRRAAHFDQVLGDAGVTLLRNESLTIDGLTLVGLDDLWTGRLDAHAAFADVRGPTICLNHDPRNTHDLLDSPWQWMLAGHTHGRQLAETRVGRQFNGHRRRRYVRGLYELPGDRKLYVNRGLSYGQRWQHWCKPEITVFKLACRP